jgi:hypothetical protein
MPDPTRDKRLGVEVIDWALEKALHLGCVQVHRDNVLNAGNMEEVGKHSSGDGAPVRLLLGLATVWEVREDG